MKHTLLFLSAIALVLAFEGLAAFADAPGKAMASPLPAEADRAIDRGADTVSDATPWIILKQDTGVGRNYSDQWAAGNMAGVVLSDTCRLAPQRIEAIACELMCLPDDEYPGAQGEVRLQAHVFALEQTLLGPQPGELLASSQEKIAEVEGSGGRAWFTYTLDVPILWMEPTPFVAVIEFKSGQEAQTPSLITDNQFDIRDGTCFFWRGEDWRSQSDYWVDPANVGATMIRALERSTTGPAYHATQTLVALEDATLTEQQPTVGIPEHSYFLVGDYSSGPFGAVRSLVGFGALEPPNPQATIDRATLMLANHRALDETVDGEIAVYAATRPWAEEAATWSSDATNFGELLDQRAIAGRERLPDPDIPEQNLNGWLLFDITEQACRWAADAESNHGVMLIGAEDTADSVQFLRSSECTIFPEYRPQLVIEWRWPDAEYRTRALLPLVTQ